jgi:hypothetical protein
LDKISLCTSTLLHFLITFLSQVLLMRHKENKTGQANTSLEEVQQTIYINRNPQLLAGQMIKSCLPLLKLQVNVT